MRHEEDFDIDEAESVTPKEKKRTNIMPQKSIDIMDRRKKYFLRRKKSVLAQIADGSRKSKLNRGI